MQNTHFMIQRFHGGERRGCRLASCCTSRLARGPKRDIHLFIASIYTVTR